MDKKLVSVAAKTVSRDSGQESCALMSQRTRAAVSYYILTASTPGDRASVAPKSGGNSTTIEVATAGPVHERDGCASKCCSDMRRIRIGVIFGSSRAARPASTPSIPGSTREGDAVDLVERGNLHSSTSRKEV
jgi:hypothetical protein